MKPLVQQYRHYTLKSSGDRAVAFLSLAKPNAGFVAEAQGIGAEDAVKQLITKLVLIEEERKEDHTYKFAVPTVLEFQIALKGASYSEAAGKMMDALVHAGADGMTAGELAEAGGYSDYAVANSLLGKAASQLADILGTKRPNSVVNDHRTVATALIAVDGPRRATTDNLTWIVRPEFKAAWMTHNPIDKTS